MRQKFTSSILAESFERRSFVIGAVQGGLVTVSSDRGSLTLPLVVADLPDRVVWVPMRTPDAAVRRDLAVSPGAVVRLSLAGGAA